MTREKSNLFDVDMLKLCKAFNNEDVVYFTVIMIVFTFNMLY